MGENQIGLLTARSQTSDENEANQNLQSDD